MDIYQKEIESIQAKHLYRTLRTPHGVDFCSNDYLGLSTDPRVVQAFQEGLAIYGCGSGASRLVRGHRDSFEQFELAIQDWAQCRSVLFVANGFTANLGLLDTLADSRTRIYTDRLNHASILDGIRISGANKMYYKHLDMDDLEASLQKSPSSSKKIIVSETVFSMDGDIPDLERLVSLKTKYDAILVLDEAHAVGILGEEGAGVARDKARLSPQLLEHIDFRILTLGKSFGLEGGLILSNSPFAKDFLINRQRNFIFSTAPMPAIPHAGLVSLEILRGMDSERKTLLSRSESLRHHIESLGRSCLQSESQIVPCIAESPEESLELASELQKRGLDIRAIRPPSVATSRLRISLNAKQSKEDFQLLLDSLSEVIPR